MDVWEVQSMLLALHNIAEGFGVLTVVAALYVGVRVWTAVAGLSRDQQTVVIKHVKE